MVEDIVEANAKLTQMPQDWVRLRSIVAPKLLVRSRLQCLIDRERPLTMLLKIDYTHVSNKKWDSMPAEDFIAMMSEPGFLGDPLLKTQHLLGATEWVKISEDTIIGHHQLRAAHLRFTAPDHKVEEKRGHSHATNEHYYKKVDGVWKFAGLKPYVRWNEYDFESIFGGFTCPTR